MKGNYVNRRDRFTSLEKRDFRAALVRLLEKEYKILGSRRVLDALADDIEQLQQEYFPLRDRLEAGTIAWVTTRKTVNKPGYGKKTEDYDTIMVYLPLVTPEDIDQRIYIKAGTKNSNYRINEERELLRFGRIVKAAWIQGGMLCQAELCVLMNRSLTTIRHYVAAYEARYPEDPLPLKGYILDQGSRPTHKGIILNLYEQGLDPTDIALRTYHGLDAVDRYIKAYERVKGLYKKGLADAEIQKATGLSKRVVAAYLSIAKHFHPEKEIAGVQLADGR
jgi:hypothetical protein